MSEGQLLALTEEIYDAAAGGTPWAAVGRSLSKLVRASNGWLCVTDHQGESASLLYRANYPDKEIAAYQAYYRHVDLWTIRTAQAVRHVDPSAPPAAGVRGAATRSASSWAPCATRRRGSGPAARRSRCRGA